MKKDMRVRLSTISASQLACATLVLIGAPWIGPASAAELSEELKSVPHKIVFETWQDGNWELFLANADGSERKNLTATPNVNELYPHVSPDGTKIVFSVDEGEGDAKVRNVYVMNMDGSGRKLVARNARQACWKGDNTAIAYLKGEFDKFTYTDYATKGIFIYDLASGTHREHPNKKLYHLYNICWSPDGRWFLATVHAGMGYRHAILAIEANGLGVYDLGIHGCRPDISPDGKRVAWGASDWILRVADLDFSGPEPKLANPHDVVTSTKPLKVYHSDWSPDGRYIAYATGPAKKRLGRIPEIVGVRAAGWNIAVADVSKTNRTAAITTDGHCNKEPDWVPSPAK